VFLSVREILFSGTNDLRHGTMCFNGGNLTCSHQMIGGNRITCYLQVTVMGNFISRFTSRPTCAPLLCLLLCYGDSSPILFYQGIEKEVEGNQYCLISESPSSLTALAKSKKNQYPPHYFLKIFLGCDAINDECFQKKIQKIKLKFSKE